MVGGVGFIIVLVIVYVVWRKRQGDARVFGTVADSESVIVITQQTQQTQQAKQPQKINITPKRP